MIWVHDSLGILWMVNEAKGIVISGPAGLYVTLTLNSL